MSVHAVVSDGDGAAEAVIAGASVLRLAAASGARTRGAPGPGLRWLGTPFYVDGDVEVALELGADGVHLAFGSAHAERARRAGLAVGLAISSALEAASAEADYLELSLADAWAAGAPGRGRLDELARICAAVSAPVVVSGRIDAAGAAACVAAGAAGVVVVGAPYARAVRAAVDTALAARGAAPAPRAWRLQR